VSAAVGSVFTPGLVQARHYPGLADTLTLIVVR
jgi:hypothetical protein